MNARVVYHPLKFVKPGGTSRGVLYEKDSWFLVLNDDGKQGIGECSLIPGLNPESRLEAASALSDICNRLNASRKVSSSEFKSMPSVQMALEMALIDIQTQGQMVYFDSDFLDGKPIDINGLIWMGSKDFMLEQLRDKIASGFRCIKIKIASISFEEELELIGYIREQFKAADMEIRLDANGGFEIQNALEKLKRLSDYDIHSVEQPIKQGNWNEMAALCTESPIDIALDEELISVKGSANINKLLDMVQPQYIILKPSLLGGFKAADLWIECAEQIGVHWWATSALESNIGLSAIAQWVATKKNSMYQGLGTGQLFSNNIPSPLSIDNAALHHNISGRWDISELKKT